MAKIKTLQLFFPEIMNYVRSPDVYFQYTQKLEFSGHFKLINKQIISICDWCKENLKDENLWYINAHINNDFLSESQKNFFSDKIIFVFDFANAEDHMAFKLRWT